MEDIKRICENGGKFVALPVKKNFQKSLTWRITFKPDILVIDLDVQIVIRSIQRMTY